jgi:cytochrome c oxidase cbb3-type subunit III
MSEDKPGDRPDIDELSGVETTGHEWDGIRELNNPMPRWWLWTFYATIIWAVGYMIAYPAIPLLTSATPGLLGYSSRGALQDELTGPRQRRRT